MKALIFQEPNQPVVKDISEPKLEATDVLVRMRQVGICHSDYNCCTAATSYRLAIL